MNCRKCGIQLSERVLKIHESRCVFKKVESFKGLPEATEENKDEVILVETETKEPIETVGDKNIKEEKTDWRQSGIDAGLNEEDLKKFMKKGTVQRQAQLKKLKGE